MILAQYSVAPSLTFSEQDAGRQIGGGGLGGLGWSSPNEGKLIAAAFLDAHNKRVTQVRTLAAKALPEAVKTKKAG